MVARVTHDQAACARCITPDINGTVTQIFDLPPPGELVHRTDVIPSPMDMVFAGSITTHSGFLTAVKHYNERTVAGVERA